MSLRANIVELRGCVDSILFQIEERPQLLSLDARVKIQSELVRLMSAIIRADRENTKKPA